ncbi:MAG: YebC/PmpR family DNA-binding transcriptional regulator [Bacteroidota bacterium]
MSGHNKWSTIKRKKGAIDAKRGKIFTKLIKEISVAASEGGADPDANPRLRLAIQNAKGVNMPKENIQRAISKANKDSSSFQEVTFEGYLQNGIGVFVECLTDNNNRTVSNIRAIFNKRGGTLGTNGSLSFLFERKGIITVPKCDMDPDEFELAMIDAGAEEIDVDEENCIITTAMEDFHAVQKKLLEMGLEPTNAELQRIPTDMKQLSTEDAVKILRVIEEFEDDDDVQAVFHSLEVTNEALERMD